MWHNLWSHLLGRGEGESLKTRSARQPDSNSSQKRKRHTDKKRYGQIQRAFRIHHRYKFKNLKILTRVHNKEGNIL